MRNSSIFVFTDTIGEGAARYRPTRLVDEGFSRDGKMFDGYVHCRLKGINESDMILMP